MNHLNSHTLLLQSQHGFTKGKSCLTNLLLFLEDITKAIDEGKPLDVIYLDFAKAFDKVPHQRLLHKIESHGISGNVAAWIGEWLHDRKRLIINSAHLKKFPYHRFSAKPAHRLSADSVFTHLCNPFLMSLPIVNTSQYQLAYALTYLTFNSFHLVMFCHFKSFFKRDG